MAAERSSTSPFPGMDPYMESRWRDVHASLIAYTRDALQPQLPDDLVARIEENVHLDVAGHEVAHRNPDVFVVESPVPWETRVQGGASAANEPIVLEADMDPLVERHIEIVDQSGGRVITAIEILSPWNKLEGSGRDRYMTKREQYLASRTNLVEIDLVRSGKWWSMVPPHIVQAKHHWPYRVTVWRAWAAGKLALYRIGLSQELPPIAVPLREGEAEVSLPLQQLIVQVYRNGRYDRTDYSKPCEPPLEGEDAAFAEQVLKAAGRR
jgi:hypothetical protein